MGTTGWVLASGCSGTDAATDALAGGGGGGSGGTIILEAPEVEVSGSWRVQSLGGNGGLGGADDADGGYGGGPGHVLDGEDGTVGMLGTDPARTGGGGGGAAGLIHVITADGAPRLDAEALLPYVDECTSLRVSCP